MIQTHAHTQTALLNSTPAVLEEIINTTYLHNGQSVGLGSIVPVKALDVWREKCVRVNDQLFTLHGHVIQQVKKLEWVRSRDGDGLREEEGKDERIHQIQLFY